MKKRINILWLSLLLAAGHAAPAQESFAGLMPGKKDYIVKSWKNGFENEARQPVLQVRSGWYSFDLDVMRFHILQFRTGTNNRSRGTYGDITATFTCRGREYRLAPMAGAADTAIKLLEEGAWLVRHTWPLVVFRSGNHPWPQPASMELTAWPGRLQLSITLQNIDTTMLEKAAISMMVGNQKLNGPLVVEQDERRQVTLTTGIMVDKANAPAAMANIKAEADGRPLAVRWQPAAARWLVSMPQRAEQPAAAAQPYPALLNFRENIRFTITNSSTDTSLVPVCVEKIISSREQGIAVKNALPILGLCFVLLDSNGLQTGLPVQVSKNWHTSARIYEHEGNWYRGSFLLRVPPGVSRSFTLQIIRGGYNGLAAATLAQLCLIGWPGKYSLDWQQVAIGNWGESITYSPEGLLGNALICDWRPLHVKGRRGRPYDWTANLGGGDWLVYYDEQGRRQRIKEVTTCYEAYGPLMPQVRYEGVTADGRIRATLRAVTFAANDINRTVFHIRYQVLEDAPFTRLAFFQMGADLYNWHRMQSLASGGAGGPVDQFTTTRLAGRKAGEYIEEPKPVPALPAWIAFTGSYPVRERDISPGWSWANRGLILRQWKAVLNGRSVSQPYVNSIITTSAGVKSSNAEYVPPPGLRQLRKGDYVAFCVEGIITPQRHSDYYGNDSFLINRLQAHPDDWTLFRDYSKRYQVTVTEGGENVRSLYPVVLQTQNHRAAVRLRTAAPLLPVKFTGLRGYRGYSIIVEQDGKKYETGTAAAGSLQVDYDVRSGTWSLIAFLPNHNPGRQMTISITRKRPE